ncbi:DNA helicase II [Bifidobacterium aemilianum]|uniref:DNA 3'-5' helicase n=1 Tax=Bifidobacterium aemilianum TaxID=2493120 RepID=A0A366KBU5_9BIFI|nr:ATP-dependent helicase [Bifidobacterium aemilianum]RBP98593.1 DNA helicase II [Bifidobacterium aemilianum]
MDTSPEAILEGLDPDQLAAATALEGPVRIIAGAGAGKTRTVTRRIAYGCATGLWEPSQVLAVTFSVKAATEMRLRLQSLGVKEGVRASTFHSAALHQLRRVWPDISGGRFPRVSENTRELVARSLQMVTNSDQYSDVQVRDLEEEINWAKVSLLAPDDYGRVCAASGRQPPAGLDVDQFTACYKVYEQEKSYRGRIDFNDILLMTCHVLDDFEDAARLIRSSISALTVDEYQDVSPLQHRLMTLWMKDNPNICVVGDPAQTIYSFAGASAYDLLNFDKEFRPLTADISLKTDYRSSQQVVHYANRVLAASPVRQDYLKLLSAREQGPRVSRTVYADDMEEARGVASRILYWKARGQSPADCAVLVRINAQLQPIRQALKAAGLSCRMRKDAIWQDAALSEAGENHQDLIEQQEARRAKVEEPVTLSTIHAAKGLEFKHVFIVGCSEGLLPYGSPEEGDQLEEERRLMYVGVTRAEDRLDLSYARSKDGMGSLQRTPSRFLV